MTMRNPIKIYKYQLESITINSKKKKWKDVNFYTSSCFERVRVNAC